MSHHNKWEESGLYRKFTNIINGDEILNSNLSIHGDARFNDITYVINDFTQISGFEINNSDITKIATFDNVASLSNNHLKIAVVATLDSLLSWINLYCDKMHGAPYECKIFTNTDDAYVWVSA